MKKRILAMFLKDKYGLVIGERTLDELHRKTEDHIREAIGIRGRSLTTGRKKSVAVRYVSLAAKLGLLVMMLFVLPAVSSADSDYTLAPDGTYVSDGSPTLAPDGTYVGYGKATLAPDGTYVGGSRSTLAPDGTYVGGDHATLAPDGTYVGGDRAVLTPSGKYVGVYDED